ncbi:MAG: RluA family pseudouridine synthase [Campylobacterota bacterium]|nr:RluA family pseudouridine synthase [Campylobacterota bacterium]
MPFVLKKFTAVKDKKIQQFLIDEAGLSVSFSQKILAKGRVFDQEGNRLQNGQKLKGDYIQVALFEGITRGLKPIFNSSDFALFDKPSGVVVHPTSRNTDYSLLDEIRYHFGDDANLGHRIDQETSGLVLVTKNKYSDMLLKDMFENKQYNKEYLAIVKGKFTGKQNIDKPIKKALKSTIGVKMAVEVDGKESYTEIESICYDAVKDQTLLKAVPLTGRQHQIRVHLDSIGHSIVGDPIYNVDELYADQYLRKTLDEKKRLEVTGHHRLLLQANCLEFDYNKHHYKFYSRLNLI